MASVPYIQFPMSDAELFDALHRCRDAEVMAALKAALLARLSRPCYQAPPIVSMDGVMTRAEAMKAFGEWPPHGCKEFRGRKIADE